MMKMNPMTMIFAICLSGSLLMAITCDAEKYKFCDHHGFLQHFMRAYHRSMERSERSDSDGTMNKEETVTRGVDVEEPSHSEQTIESASPETTEANDEPVSVTPQQEPLPIDGYSLQSEEEALTMMRMFGSRRRRSIGIEDLLQMCCDDGCDDEDLLRLIRG